MWFVRFLACLGFGGSWPNAVALVAEAWPSASRPLMAGVMGTAANFGSSDWRSWLFSFAITGDNWRWTLFIGGSPLLLAAWILFSVPESRKWLNARVPASSQNAVKAPVIEVFQRPLLYRTLLGISLGYPLVVGTAANANWIVPWTDQYESRSAAATVDKLVLTKNVVATGQSRKADPRKKALAQIQRSSGAIFGSLLGDLSQALSGGDCRIS